MQWDFAQRQTVDRAVPSQSLVTNRMVSSRIGTGSIGLGDSILVGCLVCHPDLAAERLERLAETDILHVDLVRLTEAMALVLADHKLLHRAQCG